MKRSLTPPAVLLTALALAACGSTDGSDAESEIERSVQKELGAQDVQVDCPDDVELRAGARLECRATVDDRRGEVLVSRRHDDGPLRWRLKAD